MKTGYLVTGRTQECFGCEACKQVCPQQCIELQYSFNGFLYPVIDMDRCTNCDLCRKVCPYEGAKGMLSLCADQEVYAARSKNEEVRKQSTSGGVFTELAEPILEKGGVVFGVILSQDFAVFHISAENMSQTAEMRGSKYVQSQIRETYKESKACLEKRKKVLFSGTPCQIAGLRSFLGKDYDELLTVDLICHGVLAPEIATYHIKSLEKQYRSKVARVRFRDKRHGWKQSMAFGADFENGEVYYGSGKNDRFFNMFMSNYDLRDCCYECPFTSPKRVGDITLGDFWGIDKTMPHLFDNKGHSVILVNSESGRKCFSESSQRMFYEKANLDDTSQPKLRHPTEPDIWRKYYLRSLKKRGFEKTIDMFTRPRPLWMKGLRYFQRKINLIMCRL
jgi:coenzyme F420-reducing hydrogenase beta subunit